MAGILKVKSNSRWAQQGGLLASRDRSHVGGPRPSLPGKGT